MTSKEETVVKLSSAIVNARESAERAKQKWKKYEAYAKKLEQQLSDVIKGP